MDKLLKHPSLSNANLLCYINDCVLFNHSSEAHLSDLRVLLDCFISAGLKLNPEKCQFTRDKCVFPGHEISANGQTLSDVLNVSDSDVNNVIPNGQPDFSVNPTPNIVSVVNVSSSQIPSIDSVTNTRNKSSQFCTPNPFLVLLIVDYNADTETEASDNGQRNGIRPQSVNAVIAVSVTNKKKRKTKRIGKQASRPEDVPSTSRSVIDTSDVPQQFTPAFSHFVLGGIERVHRSMAERLTPFRNNSKTNWDSVLSAITFSINTSVNSTTGYSSFMVLYGQEPQFPLSASLSQNSLLSDTAEIGDFVYLNAEYSGSARKFHYSYSGPFVIHEVKSNHIVVLRDPHRDKLFPNIHLNRCKKAHVCANNPSFVFSPDDFPPLVATRVEIPPVHNTPAISPDLSAGNPSHVPAVRRSARLQSKKTRSCTTSLCLTRPCLNIMTFLTKSKESLAKRLAATPFIT
ncbi:retrovirus-related pol polyprotein from transposon 17.6 [Plakobranchus ocellatus]|uniref:Retrovirus-related pol polyprotein from transposon 17.6 n=1 Tax=Plakobranchus ocellatus TaxID=259542 RepID=A0AAV4B1R9_9GAST|nr:retrovirus-related pol polyprotein from transposon 17.6 [Plakobranchus ocellatus]